MTSDRVRACACAMLLLCACGGGVHDLNTSAPPLLTINGHVDTSTLTRQNSAAPLIAALVWAAVPRIDPLCLAYQSNPQLQPACPDPFGVFPGEVETTVPVAADGSFTISLSELPAAAVSVGDTETRIAYGTLIIGEDLDGDGQLEIFGAGVGKGGSVGPANQGPLEDDIVAASFYTLKARQERLAFREGGFVENTNFYPAPGCTDPPQGFSLMSAPSYDSPGGGGCTFAAASDAVNVAAIAPADAQAFACRLAQSQRPLEDANTVDDPTQNLGPGGLGPQLVCLSHDDLAIVISGPQCPAMHAIALKGCADDPFCLNPEWDDTSNPPSWWPCP